MKEVFKFFTLFSLFFLINFQNSNAQMINVRLKLLSDIKDCTLTTKAEKLLVVTVDSFPEKITEIKGSDQLFIGFHEGKIFLKKNGVDLGTYSKLRFYSNGENSFFNLQLKNGKKYTYPDHLVVHTSRNGLILTNQVWIENYLAGVMAGEIGGKLNTNLLKVQAVCSRTYVYRALTKHAGEGFDVCDQTHCQAYKGSTIHHSKYEKAAYETRNEVITTENGNLIDAVFHANCGGGTSNSEEVWANEIPYLRCAPDVDFCKNSVNTFWKKMIPKSEFLAGIGKYYKMTATSFTLDKDTYGRVTELYVNGDKDKAITGENLRKIFGFKSAKFDISLQGSAYFVIGKGFGHGVGMCQDGANGRALAGWDYEKIIKHYYKGVIIKEMEIVDILTNK